MSHLQNKSIKTKGHEMISSMLPQCGVRYATEH